MSYFAILSPNTTACPSNRSICSSINAKRCAVPPTWRNCISFADILALGTAWGYHSGLFRFLWYVSFLFTNAKTCNEEAVPSTWRNCLFFVDLLGFVTAWGHHSDFFSFFMVHFYTFHWPPPFYHHYIIYILLGVCMPVFCLLADHSSVSFEVDGQKTGMQMKYGMQCKSKRDNKPKKMKCSRGCFLPIGQSIPAYRLR
jgi:hypothetical protein